jgi:hypothetical protein
MVQVPSRPVHPLENNPLLDRNISGDTESLASLTVQCTAYLEELSGLSCFNSKYGLTACKCLSMIGSKDQMSLILIHHLKEARKVRCIRIMEWLKNEKAMKELQKHKNPNKRKQQKKTVRRFFQSGVSDMDNNPLFLCRNAVVEIFNIGYYRMFKLSKYVDLPEIPMHGLAGKAPTWAKSASRVSCDEGLKLFFEDLKHEAEPHGMRVVRERTQVGLRDDDIDLIELPSSMTKRNLYHQFCYGRGYKM